MRLIFRLDHILCLLVERNLNPKAACLKRREEEKGTEFLTAQSSSVYADHAAQPLVVTIAMCVLIYEYDAVTSTFCGYLYCVLLFYLFFDPL